MKPIFLCTKDVMIYTGKSAKYSRALLGKIRIQYDKPAHLPISVFEFCDYHGIPVERFFDIINK
jgi:hypothetical protein